METVVAVLLGLVVLGSLVMMWFAAAGAQRLEREGHCLSGELHEFVNRAGQVVLDFYPVDKVCTRYGKMDLAGTRADEAAAKLRAHTDDKGRPS